MKSQEKNKRIIVDSKKNNIELYEDDDLVRVVDELYLGVNGITSSKKEGDGCTPIGIYKLGPAFGIKDLNINYPYFKIDNNTYWVDDINSNYYNCWVTISDEDINYSYNYMYCISDKDWSSAEHLIDYPVYYEYGLVIEYNVDDRISGNGSAIFFHIKDDVTAGCIATNRDSMLDILNWIDEKTMIEIK